MNDYFVQYRKELLSLALAAFGLIVCIILFIWFIVKTTKKQNRKIRNAQTMQLQDYIKLKNSFVYLFFSFLGAIGMIFFMTLLLYIVDPESFSLSHMSTSTVALYSLMIVLAFFLLSCLMDIISFFTTSVSIENETIYIQYYLFKKYSISLKDVLIYEVRKGNKILSLPVGCIKFIDANEKKCKVHLTLSDESNIILSRYLHENK